MKVPGIERGVVKTALGSIFYLMSDGRMSIEDNSKPPILCFHMSPRSSDEYLELLPLLALDENNDEGRLVIAFDLPGYGSSDNPPQSCTVDDVSDACLQAADSILGCGEDDKSSIKYIALGSLMGNYHCLSLASRYPERIKSGILINPWYNPEATGTEDSTENGTPIPDSFVLKDDGSHLVELHSKRSSWLGPDLNLRVVQSELTYLMNRRQRYLKGINIEGGNDYNFKGAAQTIVNQREKEGGTASQNRLCILGEECMTMFDKFGLEGTKRCGDACTLLEGSDKGDGSVRIESLKGDKSTLNIVNQMPDEVAVLCNQFLANI